MGTEIERKFLLRDDRWRAAASEGVVIRQGYLSVDPERTVRVRRAGPRGIVTIKGITQGATRAEFEWEIPADDADAMLDTLALRPLVEKTRYRVDHAGHTWEIDVFTGDNDGLAIAEVELTAEDEAVALPDWVGAEVTGDARYYNSSLVRTPYRDW